MRLFIALLLWLAVLVLLPAVAILAVLLLPVVWLISLPIRFASLVVEACFAFLKGVLFLPARLLGVRPSA
jgi:hypothetical protein